MSEGLHQFVSIDLPPMLTGVLAALTCGLLGNFLVLRRLSLMGDAISHAVLPGLVIAFLVSTSREPLAMFIGAGIAGVATVLLVELVQRVGGVESGAAMGVVFSVLFALGVLLIEQAAARHVDLDAECVLHGQLEMLFWFPPREPEAYLRLSTYFGEGGVPRQVLVLAGTLAATVVLIALLFKELRLAAFDAGLATSLGFHAGVLHYVLMVFVAGAVVAAFEAVGSILVIAMLICPAATARMLTDRLRTQLLVSAVVSVVTGVLGYVLGAFGPIWLGWEHSLNAAGMMTVVAGVLLAGAIFLSPSHGIVARRLRQSRLAATIAREDVLGILFRAAEAGHEGLSAGEIGRVLGHERAVRRAIARAARQGEVARENGRLSLTEAGRAHAGGVIRSHRLWETYLVRELGLRPDHVHDTAMRLEHLRTPDQERLEPGGVEAATDPHDRAIPGGDRADR